MGSSLHRHLRHWLELPFAAYIRANYRLLVAFGILILLAVAFMFGGNGVIHSFAIRRQLAELKAQNDSLAALNGWRRTRLERLEKDDPRVIEEEARRQNMKYPGETIILINPPDAEPVEVKTESQP